MTEPFKVTFGAVYPSEVDSWYFQSVLELLMRGTPAGYAWASGLVGVRTGPNLAMGRGHLLGNFLEGTDGDCLVMIDTDQEFTPEKFWELVDCFRRARQEHENVGIVAGVTWMSGHPKLANPMPNMWVQGKHQGQYTHLQTYAPDSMIEVAAVGCSNLVVGRDVAQHFADQNINPFHHISVTNWPILAQVIAGWDDPAKIEEEMRRAVWNADQLGEDLSFCTRVTDAGFRILVHTGLEFAHSKTYLLDGDDYRRAINERFPDQEPTRG